MFPVLFTRFSVPSDVTSLPVIFNMEAITFQGIYHKSSGLADSDTLFVTQWRNCLFCLHFVFGYNYVLFVLRETVNNEIDVQTKNIKNVKTAQKFKKAFVSIR